MIRFGRKLPGNVVVRRERLRSERVQVRAPKRPRRHLRAWMIPGSFALAMVIGGVLLALPISSESWDWTNGWDALFTATSAVCVTGLVRFDTAEHFNFFGELVILTLIQLGGLGVTMYAGMVILLVAGRLTLRDREFFALEVEGVTERDIRRLLRRAALYAVAVEGASFLLMIPWSLTHWDPAPAVWRSLFHSVSAFNNAGFDLMGGGRSFSDEVESPYPLFVLGTTAFLGSLSFITAFDLPQRPRRWALDTRLVVIGMGSLLILGMLAFILGEVQDGRVLDGRGPFDVVVNAYFLSANARTTGLASVDMGAIRDSTALVMLVLMFIGGASTSTASGIKIGAFMVSSIVILSVLRGRHRAQVFGREIPEVIVLRAFAVTLLGIASFVAGAWALELTDHGPFMATAFEAMSALGNVGWSQGITPSLSNAGVAVLVVLMFVGRLGPLVVAVSLPDRPQERFHYAYGHVRVG